MAFQKKIIGTLVPLSALHSLKFPQYGMLETGELFLDWLAKTGQSAWQLLPLSETQLEPGSKDIHIPSPYKSYGIGLDPKYLSHKAKHVIPTKEELDSFREDNIYWLEDYSLFSTLRDQFGTDDWTTWDEDIRKRTPLVLEKVKKQKQEQMHKYILEQWQLQKTYASLKEKAKKYNILLIGDMPYYVGLKSPLVWAYQKAFILLPNGTMSKVSGIPQTPNAYFGRQVWGHPLYNWAKEYQNVISLWKLRLSYSKTLFDVIRIDHAKGFFHYGALDPLHSSKDAYETGPGLRALSDIVDFCKYIGLSIFAEDAGMRFHELRTALSIFHVAGVRIFCFAYNNKTHTLIPHNADVCNYPKNTYAYTTLHDTEPLIAYVKKLSRKEKKLLAHAAHVELPKDDKAFAKKLRQAVINSPAKAVIIPIQDWLLTEDRINTPGTEKEKNDPNWHYRLHVPVEDLPIPART